MNPAKALDQNIEQYHYYRAENLPSAVAKIFSVVTEAEEENLINRNWRAKIDNDETISFIRENIDKIEKEWKREFAQLKPILDYGGYMEYEEMSLILSLRSDLLSLGRFLSSEFLDQYEKPLILIDEDLKAVLKLNREYTRDSRNANRKYTGGLETYLPKHWWWRYDEEN